MVRSFVRCLALLLCPALLHAQDLSRQLRPLVPGGDTIVAIAFVQPATHRFAYLESDIRLHAASTMKVPVLVELARRIDAGEFQWEDPLPIVNSFRSIADTGHFAVDAGDDSDSLPYTWIGSTASVAELARHMVVRSSNLATNLLIERLGADRVNATAHQLGADSITVLRGVEDGAAFRAGMNNTLTARSLAKLLTVILTGRAASATGTQHILALLAAQEFNNGIPGGVPAGTLVAHKTGWITGIAHDAAIVYPADAPPYVLVILTRGYAAEPEAEAVMRKISAAVFRLATAR